MQVVVGQVQVGCRDVLLEPVQLRSSWDRDDPRPLSQEPRERDLSRRRGLALGDCARAGYEPDPELFYGRQDLRLGLSKPERVLVLQRGHRLDRVGAADPLRCSLGQTEVTDLALPPPA